MLQQYQILMTNLNIVNKCGTYAGWHTHNKAKETPCEPCKTVRREFLSVWRANNKEKLREQHTQCRNNNKDHVKESHKKDYKKNKERYSQLRKDWIKNNPNTVKAYKDKWRENNRDKARESDKNWRLNNPEYGVLKEGRRRAQKNSTTVEHFTEQQVLDLYGTVCYLCNEEIDMNAPRRTNRQGWEKGLHLDHVLPLALGGGHTLDNLRPTHGICNTRKQGKIVELATAVPDTYDQS